MKSTLYIVIILFIGLNNLHAQEVISTTGGEAIGSGGSSSYTVGQTFYNTDAGTNGNSVAQGVQQPYEISVVTSITTAKDINLSFVAYPNPTTNYLIVKVENYDYINLHYLVYDISGKLLQNVKATGIETKIKTKSLVPSTYFVKVLDDKNEIKVFKIIKN